MLSCLHTTMTARPSTVRNCPQVLHPAANEININPRIWAMYFEDLLPKIVPAGDDGNYGSTACADVLCLQVCFLTWQTLQPSCFVLVVYITFLLQTGNLVVVLSVANAFRVKHLVCRFS